MSKNIRTAADNELVQHYMRKALEECTLKDCEVCGELRQVLAEAKHTAPVHLD